MRERCPSAMFVCIAKLKDYRLAFTRTSIKRGCGVADVVIKSGSDVWGVVFQIDERDIGNLDAKEGYVPGRSGNAYTRMECHVYEDGDEQKSIAAMMYTVTDKQGNVPLPNAEYKRQLVEGAIYWHLPSEYLQRLEAIRTSDAVRCGGHSDGE